MLKFLFNLVCNGKSIKTIIKQARFLLLAFLIQSVVKTINFYFPFTCKTSDRPRPGHRLPGPRSSHYAPWVLYLPHVFNLITINELQFPLREN